MRNPPVRVRPFWNFGDWSSVGAIAYHGPDDLEVWLPIGSEGQGLQVVGGLPSWGSGAASSGRWEPVTNGDPENPQIIFYNGDVEMYFVPGG